MTLIISGKFMYAEGILFLLTVDKLDYTSSGVENISKNYFLFHSAIPPHASSIFLESNHVFASGYSLRCQSRKAKAEETAEFQ